MNSFTNVSNLALVITKSASPFIHFTRYSVVTCLLSLLCIATTNNSFAQTTTVSGGNTATGAISPLVTNVDPAVSNPVGSFVLTQAGGTRSLAKVVFTTSGSYTTSDITTFTLYVNTTTNSISGAVLVPSASVAAATAGTQTITLSTPYSMTNGTRYFFIVPTFGTTSGVVDGDNIAVAAIPAANITVTGSTVSGASLASGTLTILNPAITGSSGSTQCGAGTATLTATASSGTTIDWYNALTGGTLEGTGSPFVTTSISTTTNFYAEADRSGAFQWGTISDVTTNMGTFALNGNNQLHYFSSTNACTINSIDVYASAAGTAIIVMNDGTGAQIASASFTITAAMVSNTVRTTIPLNFSVPAGATNYSLGGGAAATASIYRTTAGTYGPYTTASINGFTFTGDAFEGEPYTGTSVRCYLYNWNISFNEASSPRTTVTATVSGVTSYTVASSTAVPFVVPAGVTAMQVSMTGAAGGASGSGVAGANGGTVLCTVNVAPTATAITTLNIFVGGAGGPGGTGGTGGARVGTAGGAGGTAGSAGTPGVGGSTGGTGGAGGIGGVGGTGTGRGGGGGTGGFGGGGGGGSSEIRVGGTATTLTIVAAAGGAGGGGAAAGAGGTNTGTTGTVSGGAGGAGGNQTGSTGSGSMASGGTGGAGGTGGVGTPGGFTGGTGGTGGTGAGGGGGGYWGGAGGTGGATGGSGANGTSGGGGGGGSNYATVGAVVGVATVTAVTTNSGGSSATGGVAITILPPKVYAVTGTGSGCTSPGVVVGLSGSDLGVLYQLYNGSTAIGSPVTGTGSALPVYTVTTTGINTYTIVGYIGGSYSVCATANMSGSAAVTINPSPTVSILPTSVLRCSSDAGNTLTASGAGSGATYVWSPATALSATNTAATITTATTTTTYTVVGTSSLSCTSSATVLVSLNPIPSISVFPTSGTYCSGGGSPLTPAASGGCGACTYVWTSPSTISCTGNCSNPLITPTVAGTYTVTGSSTLGCLATATYSVTLGSTPTINITPATVTRCAYASGNLLTASGANSYVWSPAAGLSSSIISNPVTTATTTTTYTVVGTNTVVGTANTCTVSVTKLVSVNPAPTMTGVTGTGLSLSSTNYVCFSSLDQTVNYTYSSTGSPNQYTLIWSPTGPSPVSSLSALPGSFNVTVPGGTGSVSVATTYTGTITILNSVTTCTNTATAVLTIDPLPAPSLIAPPGPNVCSNTNVVYTTQAGFFGYDWEFGSASAGVDYNITGGDLSSNTITVQWLHSGTGTVTINYFNSATGCTAETPFSNTVTIFDSPTATVGNSSPICVTGTVSLTATSATATNYNWSGPGSFASTLQNPTATPTITGTNIYSLSISNPGCSPSTVFTTIVTVNPTPSSTGATNNGPICVTGVATLFDHSSNATIWLWHGSDGSTSTAQNPIVTPTVATTYSLTLSSGAASGCSPATIYPTTVTINPTPSSTGATNNSPICSGGSATLVDHSSNATAWLWHGSDGSTSTLQSPAVTPTATTTYSLTVSAAASGCNPSTVYPTTVTVNPAPTSTGATNNGPICATGNATLLDHSSNATSWLWTGSDGSTSTAQNPVVTPTATTTYSLTLSNGAGSGCSPVTIYPTTVSVTLTPSSTGATNSGPICATGSATLFDHSSNATAWLWQGSDGSTSTLQNPVVSPTVVTTYSLTVSNSESGCNPSTVYPTTVSINPTPSSTGATNNSPICSGGSATLVDHSSNATAWLWQGSDGSVSTLQNPAVTPTATTTYSLTVSAAASGCNPSTIYPTTVTVNPAPTSTGATNNGPICATGNATLLDHSSNATSWLWQGSDGSTSTAQNPVVTPTATTTYSLTLSNGAGSGCSPLTVYPTTVTVTPTPSSTGATNSSPICISGSATLFDNSSNATAWLWQGSDGSTSTLQNPVVTPTITTTYSLTVSNSESGCNPSTVYATVVSVNPAPTSTGATNSGPICQTGSATLFAHSSNTTDWLWQGSDGSTNTAQNPVVTPTATTTYSLTLSSSAESGCTSTAVYTTTLTVNALPTAAPSNNSPICNTASATLFANPAGSTDIYSWVGSDGTTSTVQNPVVSPSVTSTYTLTVSSDAGNSGCTPATTYVTIVTVNSVAAASPSGSGPICTSGTENLFANPVGGTASIFTWAGPNLSSLTVQNPTATPSVIGTSVYSLTVGAPGCTPSSYTFSVTVGAQPTLNALSSTASNPFCAGGIMTLTATSVGGAGNATYTFTGPDMSLSTSATNVSSAITTTGGAATGAYSVTLSYSGNGCNSTGPVATGVYSLTGQSTVSALSSSASNPFCATGLMTLTATASGGAGTPTYVWSGPGIASTTGSSNTAPFTTLAGPATGAYSVSLSYSGTGCIASSTVSATYTLTAEPSVSSLVSSASNPFCTGGIMTFTATSTGGAGNPTYTFTGPDIAATTSTSNISAPIISSGGFATGAYSVTLAYSGTGCATTAPVTTAVYTVTAQPSLSSLSSSATSAFCLGATMTLTATSGGGGAGTPVYTWSGPDIATTTGLSLVSPSFTTTGTPTTGQYSATVTFDGTGCTSSPVTSATYTITAQPATSALSSSESNPFCSGAVMTLTVNATGGAGNPTYTWTGPGISSTTGSASVSPSFTTSGTPASGAYSVTLSYDGTGCIASSTASGTYNMNTQPSISGLVSSASNPFCAGGVMSLTASPLGGAGVPTFTWSGPDIATTTTGSITTPGITTSSVSGNYVYTVSVAYSGTGCIPASTVSAEYTVTAQPNLSSLSSSATPAFCLGATMTLTATSGGGGAGTPVYTWSGPDIPTTTGSTLVSPTFTTTGSPATGAYSVTVAFNGTGCVSTPATTAVYSVNAQPSISALTLNTPTVNPFCALVNLVLNANETGGAGNPVYTWSGPGITTVTGSSNISPTFNPAAGTGAYSVALTWDGTGCNATSASTGVYTVLGAPVTTTVTAVDGGNTFCGSEVISATNGGDGTMYFQGTNPVGTSTLTPATTATITTTGTYYFNAQNGAGCWGTPGSITVTINQVPSANPGNSGYICVGGTVTLNATPGANTNTYQWSGPGLSLAASTLQNPTATPTVTGSNTYSLTVTDGSGNPGCATGTVYTTVVTVNATPAATVSNTGYICVGGTVTLNATPSGGSVTNYSWSGTNIVSGGLTATATATPSVTGTATYSLTVTDGSTQSGCSSFTTTIVTINATPAATASNTGYICLGGTVTLNATPSGGSVTNYSWSGTNIVSGGLTATATATPSVTGTATYSLTVTDGSTQSGCSSSTTTVVTVNSTPTATASNNSYICVGGTVTLNATPSGGTVTNYAWSGTNIVSGSLTATATATPSVTGTATYSLTVTDGSTQSGCSSSTTTIVTINATPTATASNTSYICVGGTVTLNATPSGGTVTNYAWSGTNIVSGGLTATATATPSVTGTATYSLTVTDGSTQSGCSSSTTTVVTVNATPTVSAGNSSYICVGGTATLTATTTGGSVTTYAWTDGVAYSSTSQNPTTSPTVTTPYSVTVTDGSIQSGCISTSVTTVTVNATPTVSAGNSSYICVGGTAILTATTTGGSVTTYAWTDGVAYSSTSQNPTASPTVTTPYSVTVTDGSTQSGCISTSVTTVTVNATPTVAAGNSSYICVGGTATLTATTTGGSVTTYAWTDGVAYSSTDQNPTASPTVTTPYSVTVTDGSAQSGCISTSVTTVTVNATPTVSAGNSSYICVGGTATLTATTTGGSVTTYAWTDGVAYSSTSQNPTASPTVTTPYSVTVTDGSAQSGCISTSVTTVTVNATPTVAAGNSSYICVGGTATLTATTTGGSVTTYAWTDGVAYSSTDQNPTASPTVTTPYSVTVTDGSTQSGCSSTSVTTVTVNAVPTVAAGNSSYICVGGTATLTATTTGGSVTTYAWTDGVAYSSIDQNPTASPTVTTPYSVTVTDGSTQSGCISTSVTTVTVNATPTTSASNDSYICVGGTTNLTATTTGGSVVTYAWSGANITSGTNSSTAAAAPIATGINTYTLVVTDGSSQSGCMSQSTTDVTVNPTPTAAPGNNGYICVGGTVTLAANGLNGATVFTWMGVNLSATTGANPTATPTSMEVYTVTASDGSTQSGCSPTTQYTTTVNVNPTPTSAGPINDGYICNGGTVTLAANPANGATAFTWSGANLLENTGVSPQATPTSTATYTLTVSDGSGQPGCSPATQYYTTVIVHITPTATPGNDGPICVGGTVNLMANGSGASVYSWSGANLSSTTMVNPSATPTVVGSNVYTLTVADGSTQPGCTPATQYTTAVTVKGAPSLDVVTSNTPVCATFELDLTSSGPTNVQNYLWSGPVAITTPTAPNASVPNATTAATGTYTVVVDNGPGSGCTMQYTTQATVNPLPTVFTVTGGGAYCTGDTAVHVGLSNSNIGTTYHLYYGSSPLGSLAGTGTALDFGQQPAQGTYTVLATNDTTGCANGMSSFASVTVNPLPLPHLLGSGGTNYCFGTGGIAMFLAGSNAGISYQLYLGSYSVDTVAGTDNPISFGQQTGAGDYIVLATDTLTGCKAYMPGTATVIVDSLPKIYNVTASGSAYCAGGPGVDIMLSGSDTGISYHLANGITADSILSGSGLALDYGGQVTAATYTVTAINNHTACHSVMSGNPSININTPPFVDTVTGSGVYCEGTGGVTVGLDSSTTNINYILYNGATIITTVSGTTGSAVSFGAQPAGTYTVLASDPATGCTTPMYGSAQVTMNVAPIAFSITGNSSYCADAAGVNIGISNSDTSVTYTLYKGVFPVSTMEGTGSAFNFAGTFDNGVYTIQAANDTTHCGANMSGVLAVSVNALPTVENVTGSGNYCDGSGGLVVGLDGSDTGVIYILNNGASAIDTVLGIGTSFAFGPETAGTYTVSAINVHTSCTAAMSGEAAITVTTPVTPTITVSAGASDTVCLGIPVTYTTTSSNGGLTPVYHWYVNNVLAPVATTGSYSYTPTDGDVVMAVLLSSATCATPDSVSAAVTMKVDTQATPLVGILADPGTSVCAGTNVTFTAMPTYGGAFPTFNWMKNGVFMAAGPTYNYTPANGDHVSVTMTSDFACAVVDTASHLVTMQVGADVVPTVEIIASPGIDIQAGQVDTLFAYVTNAGSAVTYQWVVNSTVIGAATNSVYSSTFNNNDSVTCQVTSHSGCNLEGFNSVKIHVFNVGVKAVTFGAGDIRLLPNPNKGDFMVKGTLGTTEDEEITMEVTDMIGQVVYKNKVIVHNGIINEHIQMTNTLANGMYMMNLHSGSDSKVFHFVIEQ